MKWFSIEIKFANESENKQIKCFHVFSLLLCENKFTPYSIFYRVRWDP